VTEDGTVLVCGLEPTLPSPERDPTPKPPWLARDPTAALVKLPNAQGCLLLRPVQWGDRLYLLPHGDLAMFCKAVDEGSEPRSIPTGPFFLRVGDHRKSGPAQPPPGCQTPSR
jgi:hypothetical protein